MQSDTEKLTGVWDIVALETEGAKLSESLFIGSKIILNGASFTTVSMGATYSGSFTVDESKNPKTMDMTFTDGTHSGAKSLAIYELNGDEWKLCLCLAGGDRPLEFSTSPGDGHAFERLIRGSASQNSGMEEFAEPNTEQDISKLEGEWEMLYGERDGAMFPEGFIESGKRSQVAGLVTVSVGGQVILKATISASGKSF